MQNFKRTQMNEILIQMNTITEERSYKRKSPRRSNLLKENRQKANPITLNFFNKQLGSGLNPQSCLHVQGFRGSKLLNGCLVV